MGKNGEDVKPRVEIPVKVACIQIDIKGKDIAFNLEKAGRMIDEAAGNGAELIVLPELFSTGYAFDNKKDAYAYESRFRKGARASFFLRRRKSMMYT